MAYDQWVSTYGSVPPTTVFGSTGGRGTPIVIDTATDVAYYLKSNVVTPLAGGGGGATTLGALTDVTLTAPAAGEVLTYVGPNWENLPAAGGSGSLDDILALQALL